MGCAGKVKPPGTSGDGSIPPGNEGGRTWSSKPYPVLAKGGVSHGFNININMLDTLKLRTLMKDTASADNVTHSFAFMDIKQRSILRNHDFQAEAIQHGFSHGPIKLASVFRTSTQQFLGVTHSYQLGQLKLHTLLITAPPIPNYMSHSLKFKNLILN